MNRVLKTLKSGCFHTTPEPSEPGSQQGMGFDSAETAARSGTAGTVQQVIWWFYHFNVTYGILKLI